MSTSRISPPQAFYERFEKHLFAVLAPKMSGKRPTSAANVAHVLAVAAKAFKASSNNVAELRALALLAARCCRSLAMTETENAKSGQGLGTSEVTFVAGVATIPIAT